MYLYESYKNLSDWIERLLGSTFTTIWIYSVNYKIEKITDHQFPSPDKSDSFQSQLSRICTNDKT